MRFPAAMRFHGAGPSALLVDVPSPELARSLAGFVRDRCPDIVDIVPAAETVLFDGIPDQDVLRSALSDWQPNASAENYGPSITIPVRYDGPDLAAVAERWGVSPREAVARHLSLEFVAAFGGFSPGFSYLTGLPAEWAVPRLTTPRTRVPPGAVAVADRWCAVYPQASPGGWSILGATSVRMWDQSRSEPALLSPGVRVRFVEQP